MSAAMTEDRWSDTPNQSSRRGAFITHIVLHADASPKESITLDWLKNPNAQASYHILLHRDGSSTRLVDDERKAWHAGKSRWGTITDLNPCSLGLAFANRQDGKEPLRPIQIEQAQAWIRHWRHWYPTIVEVVTHQMVAPTRRNDPRGAPNFFLKDFSHPLP
jgi:N-acetylmuramoyl-L-alanine amidase